MGVAVRETTRKQIAEKKKKREANRFFVGKKPEKKKGWFLPDVKW